MSVLSLSLIGVATRVVLIGVTLAVSVLLARALGPTGLGQFFLFVQLVAILAVVADAGLSSGVAAFFGRDVEANRYRYGVVLRALLVSVALTAAVAGTVLALGHEHILPRFPLTLVWLSFGALPFLLYSNIWTNMMAGMGRIPEASAAQLAGSVLWLVLTTVFVVNMGGGVLVAGVVYCLALMGQALLMGILAARLVGAPSSDPPHPGAGRELVLFAARAFPGALAYLLMLRLPVFLLNGFQTPAAVGIFSAGQQIVERTLLPIVAVQAATYRVMSSSTRTAAIASINRYLRLCLAGMVIAVVAGVVSAAPVVWLLFGEDYAGAVSVCRLMFPGVLFLTCTLLLDAFFLNQLGRPGQLSVLACAQVVLVFILALVLIPRWGPNGAAISLTLTELAGAAVYLRWHVAETGTKLRDLVAEPDDFRQAARRSRAGLSRVWGR